MYFEIVKAILDDAIPKYAAKKGLSTSDVDSKFAGHIKATAKEHNNNPDPDIDYDNYLCRLGYLFVHAGANATLMERTLKGSDDLRATVKASAGADLSVCTVGGGPGTEILGLFKFIKGRRLVPSRVNFTVIDGVQTWSETWRALAKLAEKVALESDWSVTVSRDFQTMDIADPNVFDHYEELFGEQDIIVFNYLLSENKVRLDDFKDTLDRLIHLAKPGTRFVFIDRIEYSGSTFAADVEALVNESGLSDVQREDMAGCMDESESTLVDYVTRFGGRRPRRWFRTRERRLPTAFSVVATKPEEE